MRISIKVQLGGAVIAILAVSAVLVVYVFITLARQSTDGLVIDVAGRQRMLCQKMTKESLGILLGSEVQKNREDLKKTADLFDRSLKGLIQGDPKEGLPPTTRPAILAQLKVVEGLWTGFKASIARILGSQDHKEIEEAAKSMLAANLDLLGEMNKAVGMYAQYSGEKISYLETVLIVGLAIGALIGLLVWILITAP